MAPVTLADDKERLRAQLRERRAAAQTGAVAAGAAVAERLSALLPELDAIPRMAAAGYWPIGDELDVRPSLARLAEARWTCALPVTLQRGQALTFRAWEAGDDLQAGPFGTREPAPDRPAVVPALVLVPLLGFDLHGQRLGYGAGYYDITLAALRAAGPVTAVGVGFDIQQVSSIPAGPDDQRLDWVITETAIHDCRATAGEEA